MECSFLCDRSLLFSWRTITVSRATATFRRVWQSSSFTRTISASATSSPKSKPSLLPLPVIGGPQFSAFALCVAGLHCRIIEQDPYQLRVLPAHICCLVELEMKVHRFARGCSAWLSVTTDFAVCSPVCVQSDLFYRAHDLVREYPDKPVTATRSTAFECIKDRSWQVAWFAVGSYYYLIGAYVKARKFFG
jgi:hypothetical protein